MTTTRPLLGMRRVTEVTCTEQPASRLSPSAGNQQQEAPTVDEFTVLEDKHEELKCAKPRVEQVFKVAFTIIGLLDHSGQNKTSRQIWLQLKGSRDDVSKAKEYVRGLCDPELQKEERYPVDMHCIFAGARGLFLDRLLLDTSAEVLVPEPGRLRLLGRAEPVVMAQSRVQQFVALFQEKRSLPGDRELAVKRAFKAFVEERDDKYTMELLLLPSALKEELLGLAQSPTNTLVQTLGLHAQGTATRLGKQALHAQGTATRLGEQGLHAQGTATRLGEQGLHAQGTATRLGEQGLHAQGTATRLGEQGLHAQGTATRLGEQGLHAQGPATRLGEQGLHAQGPATRLGEQGLHAQGTATRLGEQGLHAQGTATRLGEQGLHAQGTATRLGEQALHAQGTATRLGEQGLLTQAPAIGLGEADQDRSQSSTPVTELSNRILDTSFEEKVAAGGGGAGGGGGGCRVGGGIGLGPEVVLLNGVRPSHKRRSSESEMRDTKRQYSLERRDELLEREREREMRGRESRGAGCRSKTPSSTASFSSSCSKANTVGPIMLDTNDGVADDGEAVSPETNLRCLVNFFRTMGYQQEVVERVVKETGQTEDTFLILERIVEETKRCEDRIRGGVGTNSSSPRSEDTPSSSSSSSSSAATVCRSREKERGPNRSKENIKPSQHSSYSNGLGHRRQCSGSETSTQQAITIKRSSSVQGGAGNYEVITIDDNDDDLIATDTAAPGSRPSRTTAMEYLDAQSGSRTDYVSRGGGGLSPRDYLSRGGTQTLGGPSKVESVTALRSAPQWLTAASSSSSSQDKAADPISRPSAASYQTIGHMGYYGGGARVPSANDPPAPPVTGLARFHQSLKTSYTLTLPNEPGQPDLKHIIIDGSNVAMAHGLHRFFSCRGIALAVETFWKRGHREITVFVPQWRQKRDRLTTEQHFLSQLEDLRLLSFTPSREVCGQRISSHDDRFMLHLAEKTGGVIVTNDNLRDFVDTSEAWRRIIQERLLQFTFVEDHFMIPDDPLGQYGPPLEVFLRKDNRRTPSSPPPLRRPDFRPTPSSQQLHQPLYVQALHSAPRHPPTSSSSSSHWPHSSPPEWHPPPASRRTPSPSSPLPPQRSPGETSELKRKLYDIFPDQKQRIDRILSDNPYMRDLNALSALLLG